MFILLWVWKKLKALRDDDDDDDELLIDGRPRKFSYKEIVRATDKFKVKLGQGSFGNVYKGHLRETNACVAVKKVSKQSQQGRKEYESEVKVISQLRHVNLVQLMGWCHERRRELLLVYEFMPNGSLDSHLFRVKGDSSPPLSWEMRYKIARGVGTALLYLHEELRQYVLHRDIKSSNIMLDSNFIVKLGDFGLARLVVVDREFKTTVAAGTPGYMDPEHLKGEKACKASDVYSFGVVLLEIACGRRASVLDVTLVERVRELEVDGQLLDAADPKLGPLSESDARKVHHLLAVGLRCAHPDTKQRPRIGQVVQDLVGSADWLVHNKDLMLL